MIRFGVIGTSPISQQFIAAAHACQAYQFSALYSRTNQKAQEFLRQTSHTNVPTYTDFLSFLQADIDLVYIASPNSLHAEQAKKALAAKKHVIIEKPMVSTPSEFHELYKFAQTHGVFLFEAARNYHEQAIQVIREFLATQTIVGGFLSYAKYSSKMPELLAGETPNIFSPIFSGGALMDLGIYPIYAAVALFGQPVSATYTANQLKQSIDLNGVGQLFYDSFFITIQTGKNIESTLPNEIYTETGTLVLDSCQHIHSAIFKEHNGQSIPLAFTPQKDRMLEEALQIAIAIKEKNTSLIEKWLTDAHIVHNTLYSMRQYAAIQFKADLHDKPISY